MATLHPRNVPAEVMARLEQIAAAERSSVSAVAVRELDSASRRADNARLLGELPDTGVAIKDIVGHVRDGRTDR